MVISTETQAAQPDPAAPGTTAVEARLPRGGSHGRLLHNFSFPILKPWGSNRVFRCMGMSDEEGTVAGGGRRPLGPSEAAGPRIRVPESGSDPGVEEVREKLMAHLREAADRMKLVVPLLAKRCGESEQARTTEAGPDSEAADTTAALPWNLRTRRGAPRKIERHRSRSPAEESEKRTVRLRSEDAKRRERPRFSISLTKEEIDEDIYALTGCRARRRMRKRPRVIQKQIEVLLPGSCLSEITADTYRVPDKW